MSRPEASVAAARSTSMALSATCALTAAFALAGACTYWFARSAWLGAFHSATFGDLGQLTTASHLILGGHLTALYRRDPGFLGLPPAALIMLPIEALGLHGTAETLVAGTYELLLGAPVLYLVRRLAEDVGVRRGLLALQVAAGLLVLIPEFEYGHAEDTLALALVLQTVRYLLRDHEHDLTRAALTLSLAISFKQWAVVLVPLVALRAADLRGKTLTVVLSVGLPLLLAGAALLLDGHSALSAFIHPPASNPLAGHPGLAFTWLDLRSSAASRAAAVVGAMALCWPMRRARTADAILATVAIALLVRPLAETVNYSYYWAPALLLALLACSAARHRLSLVDAAWTVAALAWTVPLGIYMSNRGWWTCEIILLAVVSAGLGRVTALRPELRRHRGQDTVDETTGLVGGVGAG